jgi:hypothetical protein
MSISSDLNTQQLANVMETISHIQQMADPDDRRAIVDYGRCLVSGLHKIPSAVENDFVTALYRCLPLGVKADLDGLPAPLLVAFENEVARQLFKMRKQS